MNAIIADKLAEQLFALPYIDRAAGVAESVTRTGRDGKTKTLPVARVIYAAEGCEPAQDVNAMLPDSGLTGVLFFSSGSETVVRRTGVTALWQGRLTAHVWVDMARIEGLNPAELAAHFASQVPRKLTPSGLLSAVSVSPVGFSNTDPWQKYSLDEDRLRYLSPPYASFSLVIRYTAAVNYGCPLDVTVRPSAVC